MGYTGFRIDTMRAQNPRYSGESISTFRTWDTQRCPPIYSNLFISYTDGHWSLYDWTSDYTSKHSPADGLNATKIIDYGGTIEYVPSIGYSCCYWLSYVLLPNCHTLYNQAFRVCGLKEVVMPELRMIYPLCFEANTNLSYVNAPKCSYVGNAAFEACTSITSLILSDQVFVDNYGLLQISLINLSKLPKQMVLASTQAVYSTVLEALSEPNKCYNAKVGSDGLLEGSYYGILSGKFGAWRVRSIDMPNAWYVGPNAMASQSSLITVNLPEAKYIGWNAFFNCSLLTRFNGTKVEVVEANAFYSCRSLYDGLELPNVRTIGNSAFAGCGNLYFTTMSKCEEIGASAFMSCHKLESIEMPLCKAIGPYCFSNCTGLKRIDLPICSSFGTDCFASCSNLEYANLPLLEFVSGFGGCSALSELIVPNCTMISGMGGAGVKSIDLPLCKEIKPYCFSNCTSLESINIPLVESLSIQCFYGCTGLTSLDLPVASDLYSQVFQNCYNLRDIYFRSDKRVRFAYANGLFTNCNAGLTLHVPSSLYSEYVSVYKNVYVTLSRRTERPLLSTLFVGDL